jgi:hypothetical protein
MTSAFSPYSDRYIEFDDKHDSPGAAKVYIVADFICRYAIWAIKNAKQQWRTIAQTIQPVLQRFRKGLPDSGR